MKLALEHPTGTPLIFIELSGLFFFVTACGLVYAAERTQKANAVVALTLLTKTLMPLFAWLGYNRGEVSSAHLRFELTLDLVMWPFLVSYFFWYYHKPRPNRFVPLIGLFGQKK